MNVVYFFIPENVCKNDLFKKITTFLFLFNICIFLIIILIEKKHIKKKGEKMTKDNYLKIFKYFFLGEWVLDRPILIEVFFSFFAYLLIIFILLLKINGFFLFKFIIENKKTSFGFFIGILLYFFVFFYLFIVFFWTFIHRFFLDTYITEENIN